MEGFRVSVSVTTAEPGKPRGYETLRIGMQTLFHHVGIEMVPAAA